jgi:CRP/FNR family transcriptional regulator, nitrogen oxide reductase regulator
VNLDAGPLLTGLTAAERQTVLQAARPLGVERSAYIVRQGEPASGLYLLVSGQAKLTQVTPDGHEVIIRHISPGESFGAIAVVPGANYPVSAQAIEECQVIVWDRTTLMHLTSSYPTLATNIAQVFSQRVRELQDRVRELSTERVERRIAHALLRLANQLGKKVEGGILIELALSREELAELTGSSVFSVSRIISRWEQAGILQTRRQRILILSSHRLVEIAEDLTPPEDG